MADFKIDPSYKEVVERIADLKAKHPEATLQPADPTNAYQIVSVGGKDFVVYVAACYRTPDDQRPGIGVAWEPFPGTSNFTRNSELQNAETSAWGRAIIAALASESKHIASANEVRNRQNDAAKPRSRPAAAEAAPTTTRRPPPSNGGGPTCAGCDKPFGEEPVRRVAGRNFHASCSPAAPSAGEAGAGEATGAPPTPPAPAPTDGPSPKQLGMIGALLGKLGVPDDDRHRYVSALLDLPEPVTSMKQLTRRQTSQAIDALQAEQVPA